ncbi:zinc-binding alcohol dehydrogenase family protein [Novacetimonas hansenii]|uniref:zinc-binding alcohol dehydrogenase family protein n=1 Tax=Novacetimonas hansenii TaxID=436 RepID=UPI001115248D|nr:zinc-binding alcohol dehydrogenase family protein [Novacetimonas hansenii]
MKMIVADHLSSSNVFPHERNIMKSLVCTSFGAIPSMIIEERPKLLPLSGYTLIKMHAATVNQRSGQIRRGLFNKAKASFVLSTDGAGTTCRPALPVAPTARTFSLVAVMNSLVIV